MNMVKCTEITNSEDTMEQQQVEEANNNNDKAPKMQQQEERNITNKDDMNNNMMGQPQMMGQFGELDWQVGLFDICHDPKTCLQTVFCSCITYGETARAYNESCEMWAVLWICSFSFGIGPNALTFYQSSKLQDMYGIKRSTPIDLFKAFYCLPCQLCQMANEVKAHQGVPPPMAMARE